MKWFKRLNHTARVAVFLAFLVLLVGVSVAASPDAATIRVSILCATEWNPCVESHNGSDIVIYSDAGTTQKFLVDGALGDVTLEGTLNVGDNAYTSVGAQTLDPVNSVYLLSPVTVLTLTLATTTSVAGDFVLLVSQVATDTTVVDTGATVGGGVRTLGSDGDNILLMYDGTKWVEISFADNS